MTRLDHCIYVFLHIPNHANPIVIHASLYSCYCVCVSLLSMLCPFVSKEHAPEKKNASLHLLVRKPFHLDINRIEREREGVGGRERESERDRVCRKRLKQCTLSKQLTPVRKLESPHMGEAYLPFGGPRSVGGPRLHLDRYQRGYLHSPQAIPIHSGTI